MARYEGEDQSDGAHRRAHGRVRRLLLVGEVEVLITWCGCGHNHDYTYDLVSDLSASDRALARTTIQQITPDDLGSEIYQHIAGRIKIPPRELAIVGE